MKCLRAILTLLFIFTLAATHGLAQAPPPVSNCIDNLMDPYDPNPPCNQNLLHGLGSGAFHAKPFLDTVPDGNGHYPDYGDPDHNIQSLYGVYGNDESQSTNSAVQAHFAQGKALAGQIKPLCTDGSTSNPCPDGQPQSIVFLFIGFSNTDIEIGGGNSDVWDGTGDGQNTDPSNHFNMHLFGQPCSTKCENFNNPEMAPAYNQVTQPQTDGFTQQSLLYQVYPGPTRLLGPHMVLFDGALGGQTLAKWDPTPIGYYAIHQNCAYDNQQMASPECNWVRVKDDLRRNHFSEAQVQAIFIKDGDNFPHCDLKQAYWDSTCVPVPPLNVVQDAYQAETYLGDILRYLKCCENTMYGNPQPVPRYPNLKQVFITSRIYGGWANGNSNGCLNPEPFAYELGFADQRAIVAQINQAANPPVQGTDPYSGQLDYTVAPWFDWGPYLWADGVNKANIRSDGLVWCDWSTRGNSLCSGGTGDPGDVRFGDLDQGYTQYYGDQIHPTAWGTQKVATQLLEWMQNSPALMKQQWLSQYFGYGTLPTPWINQ